MSNIPDSVRSKGGYITKRDARTSTEKNLRYDCIYCDKKGLLQTSYGLHLTKEHFPLMFDSNTKTGKDNRKRLFYRASLTEPFAVETKDDWIHFCFGCSSVFRKGKSAEGHFCKKEKCKQIHQENILRLRDDFPKDGTNAPLVPAPLRFKATLEDMVSKLLEKVRYYEKMNKVKDTFQYEQLFGKYFETWNLDIHEESMREYWDDINDQQDAEEAEAAEAAEREEEQEEETVTPPDSPETVEEPKVSPLPPPEDDILPLFTEKPPTQLEAFQKLLADPDIDEASKRAMQKDFAKLLYSKPAPTLPAPSVKVQTLPTPLPVEPKTAVETEIQNFQKMTPWKRFLQANPSLSVQEQISVAMSLGIRPDEDHQMKIVSNSKIKRAGKQVTFA